MTNETINKKKEQDKSKSSLKADPKTIDTSDPQENMKGPISSMVQNVKVAVEKDNAETKEEADKRKEKNI